jgi:hypothetical protein
MPLSDAPSVRWLADLCGLPSSDARPLLVSKLLTTGSGDTVKAYLARCARGAPETTNFVRLTRHLHHLPDDVLLSTLIKQSYDGLVFAQHREIFGHVFFQRHGSELHGFSSAVHKPRQGRKLWAIFPLDFVAFASECDGITKARMGAGNSPITRHLVDILSPHTAALGWSVSPDGWVTFANEAPRSRPIPPPGHE